jgi:hypothetical protein
VSGQPNINTGANEAVQRRRGLFFEAEGTTRASPGFKGAAGSVSHLPLK